MLLFSTKIQAQAIDNFNNFIMQAVLPSSNEIQGFLEHNRSGEKLKIVPKSFSHLKCRAQPDSNVFTVFFRPQENRRSIPRTVLQLVQSLDDSGSRVDGNVSAVRRMLIAYRVSTPVTLSYQINVDEQHVEEDQV